MSEGRAPVAAIDCGTNTIKLLIARPGEHGLEDLVREARMVRLGQGVDATGELHPDALERTFTAIDEYAALIRQHGAGPDQGGRVRFVATSATRDASATPRTSMMRSGRCHRSRSGASRRPRSCGGNNRP